MYFFKICNLFDMNMDQCSLEKAERDQLNDLIGAKMFHMDYTSVQWDNLEKLRSKYGYPYVDKVIYYEAMTRSHRATPPPRPNYYAIDESDDEKALGKRCPLTGAIARGGRHCSDEILKDRRLAILKEILESVPRPIDYWPTPGKYGEEQWKSNISRAKLAKNGRDTPLTVAERKARWVKKHRPKKLEKTEEEKKKKRAMRNKLHYEKRKADKK